MNIKQNVAENIIPWKSSIMKRMLYIIITIILYSCNTQEEQPVIFIGDSIVEGWHIVSFFPDKVVYNKGKGGAHIEDVSTWNLNTENKKCVLLIGTNNLEKDLTEEFREHFISSYLNMVQSLKASKIIVISILPRDPEYLNPNIEKLNLDLKNELSNNPKTIFLDVYDLYLYKGKLNHSLFTDGLHLNYYGYELLSSHLYKLL